MRKVLLTVAMLVLLGGGMTCLSGCAYTHTQTGTSHFRVQVAGAGEDAALSADMKFEGYKFEFKGDPLALGLRVVNDIKTFIGSIFTPNAGS